MYLSLSLVPGYFISILNKHFRFSIYEMNQIQIFTFKSTDFSWGAYSNPTDLTNSSRNKQRKIDSVIKPKPSLKLAVCICTSTYLLITPHKSNSFSYELPGHLTTLNLDYVPQWEHKSSAVHPSTHRTNQDSITNKSTTNIQQSTYKVFPTFRYHLHQDYGT